MSKFRIAVLLIVVIAIISIAVVILNPFEKAEQEEEFEPFEPLDVTVTGTEENEIYYVPMKAGEEERLKLTIEALEISGFVNIVYVRRYWDMGEDFRTSLWDTNFQMLTPELETACMLNNTNREYAKVVDENTTFFLSLGLKYQTVEYHVTVEQTVEQVEQEPEGPEEPEEPKIFTAHTCGLSPWRGDWVTISIDIESMGFEGNFRVVSAIFDPIVDFEMRQPQEPEDGYYLEENQTTWVNVQLRIAELYEGTFHFELCGNCESLASYNPDEPTIYVESNVSSCRIKEKP